MVNQLSYVSFQPVLHNWFKKGHCTCYRVCGMVHIKNSLLLIGNSSLCVVGEGFFSCYQSGTLLFVIKCVECIIK